jgi:hypothetical protein
MALRVQAMICTVLPTVIHITRGGAVKRIRVLIGALAAAALTVLAVSPAGAITNGQLDNGEHPYVGVMVAYVGGQPAWRCSGTLVSPTHFLTAGHCTYGADSAAVWFEDDLRPEARGGTGYPLGGGTSYAGTPHTHPQYDDNAFYQHDLGLVVLKKKVKMPAYGSLPKLGFFDGLFVKRGQNKQTFTAVGYGLQRNMPEGSGLTQADVVRMKATLSIINADAAFGEKKAGNSVLFTNNAATGGTCNGDSGGPIFIAGTTTVAAVTSFGMNARCAGTGGGYRVDTADDLNWLATFKLTPAK